MSKFIPRAAGFAAIALAVGALGASAQAAETVKVTFISGYPTAAT
jgi:hypothetical protein